MPQLKNKTKPAPKKSNELKECQEAILKVSSLLALKN